MNTLFYNGGPYHIETSPLIYRLNQLICFYMIRTSVIKQITANKKNWKAKNYKENQGAANNLEKQGKSGRSYEGEIYNSKIFLWLFLSFVNLSNNQSLL